MSQPNKRTGTWTSVCVAGALVALGGAIWVRGIEGNPLPRLDVDVTDDSPDAPPRIQEPVQFLSPGALSRVAELDDRIDPGLREAWLENVAVIFSIEGCPKLLDWFNTDAGLAFERHVAELRLAGSEGALASLCLYFQLARSTEWDPGLLARTQHAEKLGTQLEEWLFLWGGKAATDPLLFEPALCALLFYGKVMHTAYDAPLMGFNDAAHQRARTNVVRLVGTPGERTDLGRFAQERYSRAVALIETNEDLCKGLAEECETRFPYLDGECEEE